MRKNGQENGTSNCLSTLAFKSTKSCTISLNPFAQANCKGGGSQDSSSEDVSRRIRCVSTKSFEDIAARSAADIAFATGAKVCFSVFRTFGTVDGTSDFQSSEKPFCNGREPKSLQITFFSQKKIFTAKLACGRDFFFHTTSFENMNSKSTFFLMKKKLLLPVKMNALFQK